MKLNKFFFNNFGVLIFANLASVFAYLYWFLLGNVTIPTDFGEISIINSYIAIFFTPIIIIPSLLTKLVNYENNGELNKIFFKNLIIKTILFLFPLGITIFFLFNKKINFYNFILIFTLLFIAIFQQYFIAVFQAKKKYILFSIFNSAVIYLKLFLFLLFFFIFQFSAFNSFIYSFIFATVISMILAIINSFKLFDKDSSEVNISNEKFLKNSFFLIASNIIIVGFLNLDIIILSNHFDQEIIASYNANILFAKAIFYGSISVITILFPEVASLKNDKNKIKRILLFSSSLCILLSIFGIIIIYNFGPILIDFTYSGKYYFKNSIFLKVAITMIFVLLSNLIIFSSIGNNNYGIVYFNILPIALYLTLSNFFNSSLDVMSMNYMISSSFFFIINLAYIYIKLK